MAKSSFDGPLYVLDLGRTRLFGPPRGLTRFVLPKFGIAKWALLSVCDAPNVRITSVRCGLSNGVAYFQSKSLTPFETKIVPHTVKIPLGEESSGLLLQQVNIEGFLEITATGDAEASIHLACVEIPSPYG